MHIAIVSTPYMPWGGSEELWSAMADEARRDGHEVSLSVYRWPSTPVKIRTLEEMGVQVQRRHPFLRRARPGLLSARCKVSPFSRLFRAKPDVVLVSLGTTYECVKRYDLLHALYEASIPYVVILQLNDDAYVPSQHEREITLEFFTRAARVLFVSQANKLVAERQLACQLVNASVVLNPVNMRDVSIVPWPSPGTARLASVARLTVAQKGQDLLFEALSSDAWSSRDWRLRLYGSGKDNDYLRALASHYGIAQHVEFQGHVDNVRDIWADNHLCVMPSRYEGTPLALVEAMLCGRPAVVTDVGGNVEWVDDHETAFVAAGPSTRNLGQALERAWLARDAWRDMGTRAHERAAARIDPRPGWTLLQLLLDQRKQGKSEPAALRDVAITPHDVALPR